MDGLYIKDKIQARKQETGRKDRSPIKEQVEQTYSSRADVDPKTLFGSFFDCVKQLSGCFYCMDKQHRLLASNLVFRKHLLDITGIEIKETLPLHHPYFVQLMAEHNDIFEDGSEKACQESIMVNHRPRPFLFQKKPMRDMHGNIVALMAWGLDLSWQQDQIQKMTAQLASMQQRFAHQAHDQRKQSLPDEAFSPNLDMVCNPTKDNSFVQHCARVFFGQHIAHNDVNTFVHQLCTQWITMLQHMPDTFDCFDASGKKLWRSSHLKAMCKTSLSTHGFAFKDSPYARKLTWHTPVENKMASETDQSQELVATTSRASDDSKQSADMDVTDVEKSAKDRLALQTELIMGMAHDLRTPLSGIMTTAQCLSVDESTLKNKQRLLDITTSASLMLSMLDGLFSKVSPDQSKANQKKVFSLYGLMEELKSLMKPVTDSTGEVNVEFLYSHDKDVVCKGGGDDIARILMNIISNAIKYTDEGSVRIACSICRESKQQMVAKFVISDTGIGIEKTKVNKIFEDFSRLDEAYVSGRDGKGFGLSVVKRLVNMQKGYLSIQSQKGRGTRVTCWFPLRVVSQSSRFIQKTMIQHSSIPLSQLRKEAFKVLLVEDDAIAAHAGSGLLEHFGCDVHISTDGASAYQFIRKYDYDFVLLDVYLPDTDGFRLARMIRRLHREKPIYMLTSCQLDEFHDNVKQYKLTGYLIKPLTIKMLQEVFLEVYQKKRHMQSRELDTKKFESDVQV
jgi:signal transduction histidine kinase/CheY-like chemotaxis protein